MIGPQNSQLQLRSQRASVVGRRVRGRALGGLSGGSSEYAEIVLALTTPKDSRPIRWTSLYSSMPTATAAPWNILTTPWTNSQTVTQTFTQLPVDTALAFVFRDAERAIVMYDPNPTAKTFTYAIYGVGVVSENAASVPSVVFVMGVDNSGVTTPLKTPYMLGTTPYQPHGPMCFAGAAPRDEMRRYFWLDGNATATSTVSGTVTCFGEGAFSGNFLMDLWSENGESLAIGHVGVSNVAPGFVLNVPKSGYYAFSFQMVAETGTLSMNNLTYSSSSSTFQHLCIPHYDVNVLSVDGIRVISASGMYTNEAAPINAQGKVVGVQLPVQVTWMDYIRGSPISQLTSTGEAATQPAATGIYGFLKPTQPSDFNINTHVQVVDNILVDSFYPLGHDSAFLAIGVSITTLAGQDGYFTFAFGVEYQTTDVWREVTISPCSEQLYDAALRSLRPMRQWHENPLHMGDIMNWIKKAGSAIVGGIQKYGPTVMKVAETAAPLFL
jgi:hypothetical protein